MSTRARFPDDFRWGVATAAYQIEGATTEDGRGESIWDRFSHTPGRVLGGDTGDVACDHYHRWRDDVALMAELGVGAYRFSIAWPRVLPEGRGRVNPQGLGFYDRLVDALLEAGIRPFPTLYHWDLPQVLEDAGGWPARATAEAFAEYASVVASRLGDRVTDWFTINEPWVVTQLGYVLGLHAPGRAEPAVGPAVAHHLLVAHGLALERIRAACPRARVGIVLNLDPMEPRSLHPADVAEARLHDASMNRWYLDPISGRDYPREVTELLEWDRREVRPGDMEIIATPIDRLGVNYYRRQVVAAASVTDEQRPLPWTQAGPRFTEMGWEVYPPGLYDLLRRLHCDYGFAEYLITENGAAFPDPAPVGGRVSDPERVAYLRAHLLAVHRAIGDGVPVGGYFVWSLLDNFEWAFGYSKRFGIVHVDFADQTRTWKDSAAWYRDVATNGSVS